MTKKTHLATRRPREPRLDGRPRRDGLRVILKTEDGAPVAFFPELPGTSDPFTCAGYRRGEGHFTAEVSYAAALRRSTHWSPEVKTFRHHLAVEVFPESELIFTNRFSKFAELRRRRAIEESRNAAAPTPEEGR